MKAHERKAWVSVVDLCGTLQGKSSVPDLKPTFQTFCWKRGKIMADSEWNTSVPLFIVALLPGSELGCRQGARYRHIDLGNQSTTVLTQETGCVCHFWSALTREGKTPSHVSTEDDEVIIVMSVFREHAPCAQRKIS